MPKNKLEDKPNNLSISDLFEGPIDLYFSKDRVMFTHLYNPFNKMIEEYIPKFVCENEWSFYDKIDGTKKYRNILKFSNIAIQKPIPENEDEIMYPSDAAERKLTYSSKILADISQFLEVTDNITGEKKIRQIGNTENGWTIANMPIMVGSKYCSSYFAPEGNKSRCKYDPCGYFIIGGNEKIVIAQDKMVDNKPLVFLKKDTSTDNYVVQVNSKSPDNSGTTQILVVKYDKDNQLKIKVPVIDEIPITVMFRALGIESDETIAKMIIGDMNDSDMIELLRMSLEFKPEKESKIYTKTEAYDFLKKKIKQSYRYTESDPAIKDKQQNIYIEYIINKNVLPHIEKRYKPYYLGYIINKLLRVMLGREQVSDRDSYINKRVELPGDLIFEIFRQQFKKMLNECNKFFKKQNTDDEKPVVIISQVRPTIIDQGIKTALMLGFFGRRKGVAQVLARTTFLHTLSFYRRIDAPGIESTNKLINPRLLHASSAGYICPVETPEHSRVGLVKHLTMVTNITVPNNAQTAMIKDYLEDKIIDITDVPIDELSKQTKIFLNGEWLGIITPKKQEEMYNNLREKKLKGDFDMTIGVVSDVLNKEIHIYSDGGRMYRPLLQVENNKLKLTKEILNNISLNVLERANKVTDWNEFLMKYPGIIEYVDMEEQPYYIMAEQLADVERERIKMINSKKSEGTEIVNRYDDNTYIKYTHCELHPSLLLGVIAANIPHPEHNQGPRNIFQYNQGRQAMSIYATNYRDRFDTSWILYHPMVPLITTREAKYTFTDILCPGENVIVALATYGGWNQEDAIIINESAIQRGLFRSMSLKKYSIEIQKNQTTAQNDVFMRPDHNQVAGMRVGSYDKLNDKGYVPEETRIEDGDIILSKLTPIPRIPNSDKIYKDNSIPYRSHAPGVIDRVWINIKNADGYDIRKVRTRSERKPEIGDKFCIREDAEVLTTKGWIKINEVTKQHKVATLVDGKYLEYVHPTETYEFDYSGDMYKLRSQQVDLDVTIDHDLYVKEYGTDAYKLTPAANVCGKKYYFKKNSEDKKMLHDKYSDEHIKQIAKSCIEEQNVYDDILYATNQHDLQKILLTVFDEEDVIVTKNMEFANKIMIMAVHGGWSANIIQRGDEQIIKLNKEINENEPLCESDEIYKYEGKVYCLQVPSHVFMIRQNNKNVWIGNCCFTDEHDVLTTKGWVNIKDVTLNHKVASLIDGKLKYVHPKKIYSYEYDGKLYEIDTNQVSLMVTPNHRMYVGGGSKKSVMKIEKAENIYGMLKRYKKNIDEEYIPNDCLEDTFEIPEYLDGNGKLRPAKKVDLETWIKFFGIWVAEGCVNRRRVMISANKQRVKDVLKTCIPKMGFRLCTWDEHPDPDKEANINENGVDENKSMWAICDVQLSDFMEKYSVGAVNKKLPSWVWKLRGEHCKLLIEHMLLGDGHNVKGYDRYRYDTSSLKLSDDFQRLCLHAGWASNRQLKCAAGAQKPSYFENKDGKIIKIQGKYDAWRLSVCKTQVEPTVNKHVGVYDYDEEYAPKNGKTKTKKIQDHYVDFTGQVYCCQVCDDDDADDAGIIYVRRKGVVVWSGQSRSGQKGTCGITLKAVDMPFTKEGIIPDLIVNPAAIPTRMTVGQLIEAITGKLCAIKGRMGDGTAFVDVDIGTVQKELEENGYNGDGTEWLYNGMTGKKMKTKIFICPTFYERLKHMVLDKIHCLTMDHEVLTKDGFKFFNQLSMDDKIATLKDNKIVYEKPIKLLYYPDFEGKLYNISNQQIDLRVTEDHRMWVSRSYGREQKWLAHDFMKACDIVGKQVRYKKDAINDNPKYQFILPSVYMGDVRRYTDEKKVDMEAWLTFFGIWIAEGWTNHDSKKSNHQITICQCKERVRNIIFDAITKLGYNYNITGRSGETYQNGSKIRINNKQLYSYLEKLSVGAPNKYLPDWVWELDIEQSRLLLNSLILGDGTYRGNSVSYYTSSKRLADDVMRLALHAGWSGNIWLHSKKGHETQYGGRKITAKHDMYRIGINKNKNNPTVNHGHHEKQNIQKEFIEHSKEPVFCLEVPSEVFYVRRNGKGVWTGNSRAKGPRATLTRRKVASACIKVHASQRYAGDTIKLREHPIP